MSNNTKKTIFQEVVFLAVCVALMNAVTVEAASPKQSIREGNLFYQNGNYIESKRKYMEALEKDPESDIINFNLGTSLYKEEQYPDAIDHFQKVFLSEDDKLKGRAHYNLGNTLYKLGMVQEKDGDTAAAISSLGKSLSAYERALSIDGNDEDAKYNYAFVQKELQRLKEQQQQQEQQQQNQKQNSDQSKGDQQQQQDQNQQSENDQNQEGQENQPQQDQQQGQGQERQDQQNNSEQGRGHEDKEDYNKQNEAATQPQNASELTQEEAQMLLESYQQAEEPKEQLNVHQMMKDPQPVSKDW